jgi:hypothetical protein
MSRATREAVYATLFAKLQAVPGLVTVSRRLQNVQDMQPEQLPAAFQLQGQQDARFTGANPTTNTWRADWLLYAYDDDPTSAPSVGLNAMIDAAVAALAPPPYADKQTLGGLVEYAAIDGSIQVFEGALGNRAVAVLPITLVLPGF